jgi:uncharacterized SAM-binding protein YcdF (DUF218 family)
VTGPGNNYRHHPRRLPAWSRALMICLVCAFAAPAAAERTLVVFGSSVRSDGKPSPSMLRWLQRTLVEARRDRGASIVLSGGTAAGRAEGPFMARWLTERGVDRRRLLIESSARHTGENADLSVPLIKRAGADRVTVVTERFHVRRARFHMRAALKEQGLGALKVDASAAPDGLRGVKRLQRWFKESTKIARDVGFRGWNRVKRGVNRHLARRRQTRARR